jgi:carbonic anhydrase
MIVQIKQNEVPPMQDTSPIQNALDKLLEGNRRFVSQDAVHPNQDGNRRVEATKGQKPFAVIVGCSDSRIPPEIIFDQGIGDIFVIRVAGNIVDDIALGSIEYAVDHLGSQLVLVLGHSSCGAVTATVQGGETHGHITSIVKAIKPAVEEARGKSGDLTDNSIRANVGLVAKTIASSKPILSKMTEEGKVVIIPAYYHLDTGLVELL